MSKKDILKILDVVCYIITLFGAVLVVIFEFNLNILLLKASTMLFAVGLFLLLVFSILKVVFAFMADAKKDKIDINNNEIVTDNEHVNNNELLSENAKIEEESLLEKEETLIGQNISESVNELNNTGLNETEENQSRNADEIIEEDFSMTKKEKIWGIVKIVGVLILFCWIIYIYLGMN